MCCVQFSRSVVSDSFLPHGLETQASLVVQERVDHISHYPGRYSLLDTTPADF